MIEPVITELPWCDPCAVLPRINPDTWSAFLDSGGDPSEERARWSFFCPAPKETLCLRNGRIVRNGRLEPGCDVTGDLLWQRLRAMRPPAAPKSFLPFTGGLIGMASYTLGLHLENIASRHVTDEPELIVMACDEVFVFDRLEKRLWWASGAGNPPPPLPETDGPEGENPPAPPAGLTFMPDLGREEWLDAVRRTIDFISAGDIFQANLTCRWQAARSATTTLPALYRRLRRAAPAPFGAYLSTPDFALLSTSVERFLSLSADGRIETRPIKGTAPISADPQHNARLAERLSRDEKERAENLMITDLMRHDIGRIARLGSISVPQLCAVERFAHLHHLVSSVRGALRPGRDAFDLLNATLPPGSVSGAPKHRALQIIDLLEGSARGAYCGSVFRIGRDGAMDSSVIIRSVSATADHLRIGAGGGITWPSDPEREYAEMCLKAAPLLKALSS